MTEKDLPQRKHPRLKEYDYSQNGAYFLTFCTKNRRPLLSRIPVTEENGGNNVVGRDAHIPPQPVLTPIGAVVDTYIKNIHEKYDGVSVDHYVIMPNHVHLLLTIDRCEDRGGMRASRPTTHALVRSLKTMVTKTIGRSIWQASYYDHVIRTQQSYFEIWQYIDENPAKWQEDDFFLP